MAANLASSIGETTYGLGDAASKLGDAAQKFATSAGTIGKGVEGGVMMLAQRLAKLGQDMISGAIYSAFARIILITAIVVLLTAIIGAILVSFIVKWINNDDKKDYHHSGSHHSGSRHSECRECMRKRHHRHSDSD